MILGYRLRRGDTWGNAVTGDDYKDVAVQIVGAYDADPTVAEYVVLQRRGVAEPWARIGGATRDNGWSARGRGDAPTP